MTFRLIKKFRGAGNRHQIGLIFGMHLVFSPIYQRFKKCRLFGAWKWLLAQPKQKENDGFVCFAHIPFVRKNGVGKSVRKIKSGSWILVVMELILMMLKWWTNPPSVFTWFNLDKWVFLVFGVVDLDVMLIIIDAIQGNPVTWTNWSAPKGNQLVIKIP